MASFNSVLLPLNFTIKYIFKSLSNISATKPFFIRFPQGELITLNQNNSTKNLDKKTRKWSQKSWAKVSIWKKKNSKLSLFCRDCADAFVSRRP